MRISDWSSDVCSSDLAPGRAGRARRVCVGSFRFGINLIATSALPRLPPFTQITRTCSSQAVAASTDSAANRQFPCPPLSERRSEEHTSELQSLMPISYAVFCLTKKTSSIYLSPHLLHSYSLSQSLTSTIILYQHSLYNTPN